MTAVGAELNGLVIIGAITEILLVSDGYFHPPSYARRNVRQIHFSAQHEGELQPMVWTRPIGNGRVCYICPGYRTATMKQPQMQKILRRGLAWVVEDGHEL